MPISQMKKISMQEIRKSSKFEDITSFDKKYWLSKTPEERLDAALKLILTAKEIYKANPLNPALNNGTRIFKSDTPIKRRKR